MPRMARHERIIRKRIEEFDKEIDVWIGNRERAEEAIERLRRERGILQSVLDAADAEAAEAQTENDDA